MNIDDIKKVCFIGAGTMGCFNSLMISIFDYECIVYDISHEVIKRTQDTQKNMIKIITDRNKLLTKEMLYTCMSKVIFTSDIKKAVQNADLLSESVPENLELKRAVHKQLDDICPDKTIITTNTSSLLVSEIEDVIKRKDKFAAMHFNLGGTLVDIMGGPKTSQETVNILERFIRGVGLTPVVMKKEKDGYLFNSILYAMIKTAVLLVIDGYANFDDIDRSYMAASGNKMGPFGILDSIGLDLCMDAIEGQEKRTGDKDLSRISKFLKKYVDEVKLGIKTGRGFYSYPNPEFAKKEFLR